jgi:hypothetical protein
MQRIREAFSWDHGRADISCATAMRSTEVTGQTMGMEEVMTALRSPGQNPYVEPLIGSVRRACLEHSSCGMKDRCAELCEVILPAVRAPGLI